MPSVSCLQPNFAKRGGLVTVVTVETYGKVLMVASANEVAFRLTIATGLAHYWSTSDSRRQPWRKGATSGNTQRVLRVLVDCDGDAVIYVVDPNGPACHTGNHSCFFRDVLGDVTRAKVASPRGENALSVLEAEVSETLLPARAWYGALV